MAENDRRRGQSDGAKGDYNPPQGTGFVDCATRIIFGQTEADRDYERGHEEGKDFRKKH